MMKRALSTLLALTLLIAASVGLYAARGVEDPTLDPPFDDSKPTRPSSLAVVPPVPTKRALFGDLHVHTSYSVDAFIFGVRALPDDAYHFAKGGTIEHGAGYPIRLSRPLDFLAVTDHAEYLGSARAAQPDVPTVRRNLRSALTEGGRLSYTRYWVESVAALTGHAFNSGAEGQQFLDEAEQTRVQLDAWRDTIAAAERANDPGRFTAFIGYEWSSHGIHRNVVYGSDAAPDYPFSALDSQRAQDLWLALEAQRAAGQPVIAIPHNMNESSGRMYPREPIEGLAWTREEAERRRTIEPVSEVYQVKGSSEAHPALSPDDPFADFEIVERLYGDTAELGREGSYARAGLRTGLELAMDEGWNPYVFGLIASSDSHNASATVEEDNHHGKLPVLDGSAGIRSGEALLLPTSATPGASWGGGGLAAVWAEENTRASIFAALERRETFATSGTRLQVRFFGGWALDPQTLRTGDAVAAGYRDGVPMGGFLPPRPEGSTPQFLVWADKDPVGANLDRIQIVKGWVEADGVSRERVHDVAVAGKRAIDGETGLHEPVGNTVDVDEATWTNTIGAAHLAAHWIDPDFSPDQDAFYYVRVLEIPTPRMSTYDAKALGRAAPEPTAIQERAATSAIWFDASGASALRAP